MKKCKVLRVGSEECEKVPSDRILTFFCDETTKNFFFNEKCDHGFVQSMEEEKMKLESALVHCALVKEAVVDGSKTDQFFIPDEIWDEFLREELVKSSCDVAECTDRLCRSVVAKKEEIETGLQSAKLTMAKQSAGGANAATTDGTKKPAAATAKLTSAGGANPLGAVATEPLQVVDTTPSNLSVADKDPILQGATDNADSLPQQLHDLAMKWLSQQCGDTSGVTTDASKTAEAAVVCEKLFEMLHPLSDKRVEIQDTEKAAQAWEIINKLLLALQLRPASEEESSPLDQQCAPGPASVAYHLARIAQDLRSHAINLVTREEEWESNSQELDDREQKFEEKKREFEKKKRELTDLFAREKEESENDKAALAALKKSRSELEEVVRKLKEEGRKLVEQEQTLLDNAKRNQAALNRVVEELDAKRGDLSSLRVQEQTLLANAERNQTELQRVGTELQDKRADLLSLGELVPASTLITVVGGLLNWLEENETVALLTTAAEWARDSKCPVILPPVADQRVGKCSLLGDDDVPPLCFRCLHSFTFYFLWLENLVTMFQLSSCQRYVGGESDSTYFVELFVQLLEISFCSTYSELDAKGHLEEHASKNQQFWREEERHLLELLESRARPLCKLDPAQPQRSPFSCLISHSICSIPCLTDDITANTENFKELYWGNDEEEVEC